MLTTLPPPPPPRPTGKTHFEISKSLKRRQADSYTCISFRMLVRTHCCCCCGGGGGEFVNSCQHFLGIKKILSEQLFGS